MHMDSSEEEWWGAIDDNSPSSPKILRLWRAGLPEGIAAGSPQAGRASVVRTGAGGRGACVIIINDDEPQGNAAFPYLW
jgi:hypothetical protein